jgi:hypothetical protein
VYFINHLVTTPGTVYGQEEEWDASGSAVPSHGQNLGISMDLTSNHKKTIRKTIGKW